MKVPFIQYALAERALGMGWDQSQIIVLDGDLGKSGQSTTGREDFHRLMAAVGLGEVGAVFALFSLTVLPFPSGLA